MYLVLRQPRRKHDSLLSLGKYCAPGCVVRGLPPCLPPHLDPASSAAPLCGLLKRLRSCQQAGADLSGYIFRTAGCTLGDGGQSTEPPPHCLGQLVRPRDWGAADGSDRHQPEWPCPQPVVLCHICGATMQNLGLL